MSAEFKADLVVDCSTYAARKPEGLAQAQRELHIKVTDEAGNRGKE